MLTREIRSCLHLALTIRRCHHPVWDKVGAPSAAKAELANLDGCFYLVRPTVTVKGAKECLCVRRLCDVRVAGQC